MKKTLSIIKPDGTSNNLIGSIIKKFEENNLKIIGLKMIKISKEEAGKFYTIHKEKPFFDSLTDFISEGTIVPMVIYGKDAISKVREIMGETDPRKALKNTIRYEYAESIDRNVVHGSDSEESADFEISFFFSEIEID